MCTTNVSPACRTGCAAHSGLGQTRAWLPFMPSDAGGAGAWPEGRRCDFVPRSGQPAVLVAHFPAIPAVGEIWQDWRMAAELPPPARRTRKYRMLRVLLRGGNRTLCWALRRGLAPRAFALLETTGRRSGQPRYTPIGNGLDGDRFWLIAAHGRQADYVRNLIAEPAVRVLAGRSWRRGTAVPLPGDDTARRSRTLPYGWDAAIGRALATTPLTIRIDLEPPGASAGVSPGFR